MSAPCDRLCPFFGCPECAYKSGETVTPQQDSGEPTGSIGGVAGRTAAPGVRQHSEGLTAGTSPIELDEGGKPMAANDVTPERPGGARNGA